MSYPTIDHYEVLQNSGYGEKWLVIADYGDAFEADDAVPASRRFTTHKAAVAAAQRLNDEMKEKKS